MCGFAGYSHQGGVADDCLRVAGRMLGAVLHRGPDGTDSLHRDRVTLAHCALPFVDPGLRQPFVSASGRTVVVFNGEIYNHPALRRELLAAGVPLRTSGDTETLVECYEREGVRFVDRLRGMFAFALHDALEDRLILARDPFGKKPLYYARVAGGVAFASELTALLQHPDCRPELDVGALADYLVLQAVPAPASILDGVRKIRPGTYVEVVGGRSRETTYWTPGPTRAGAVPVPPEVAAGEFERLLRAAVDRRMGSTREPLGVLLSGGLDSSAVTALAQQRSDRPVATFSAGFTDAAFDESGHAQSVARHLGTEHHAIRIGPRALEEAATTVYGRLDEPLADPSLLPTALICREARRHVRGVLTGDGADELLLGYRFFEAERVMGTLVRALPAAVLDRLPLLAGLLPLRGGNLPPAMVLRQLARGLRSTPERRFYESTAPFGRAELPALFHPDAWARVGDHRPYRELDSFVEAAAASDPLERAQLGIICHFLRDVVLTKLDRGSMLHGLEARSPFLDLDLFEYCASLPVALKLRGLTGKHLLRRVAAPWLPPAVITRRKLGFRAPLGPLLTGGLRPLLLDTLSAPQLERHGLFRPHVVRRLIDDHLAGRRDNARRLWALLCFQLWHQGVLVPSNAPRPVQHAR